MCVICGCGQQKDTRTDNQLTVSGNRQTEHAVPTINPSTGDLHFGVGPAKASVPGISQIRSIKIETDVLSENARLAATNRAHFKSHGVTAYDLVSSPGSGKTTLLCKTIDELAKRGLSLPIGVIEGDQQTSLDAERIRGTGASAIQVNTGKGCHLDALMVGKAFAGLGLHAAAHEHEHAHESKHETGGDHEHVHHRNVQNTQALLFIENVGNLVCPAMWDLGEAAKIVILSVTEGDDKPLKYPDMFAAAGLLVINKCDLLPYVNFDVRRCLANARKINPGIDAVAVSAISGNGITDWIDWLLCPELRQCSAAELRLTERSD